MSALSVSSRNREQTIEVETMPADRSASVDPANFPVFIRASGRGAMHRLALHLGICVWNVQKWERVPPKHLAETARFLGIPPAALRPDLAAIFQPAEAARDAA